METNEKPKLYYKEVQVETLLWLILPKGTTAKVEKKFRVTCINQGAKFLTNKKIPFNVWNEALKVSQETRSEKIFFISIPSKDVTELLLDINNFFEIVNERILWDNTD